MNNILEDQDQRLGIKDLQEFIPQIQILNKLIHLQIVSVRLKNLAFLLKHHLN